MSDTAALLLAIASLLWFVLAAAVLVVLRKVLAGRGTELTRLGVGPGGVTMEFAEASLSEAVAMADQQAAAPIGEVAKRSVLDRLRQRSEVLAKARILWVDDHPENNEPLVRLLNRFGASVDTPRSNEEALAFLGVSRYDVVITDVARDSEGPDGELKGLELADAVFQRWGQRVLLFTARFNPATLPDVSDARRLELVQLVDRSVFARTNRADEVLHYALDLLER